MKNLKALVIMMMAGSMLYGCMNKDGFDKTPNGLKYKLHTKKEGKKPQKGDIMTLGMIYKTDKDSILFSTYTKGSPVKTPMMKPSFVGGIEEGFALLSEGDSATFLISADSLFEKMFMTKLPSYINKGSYMTFEVKMEKIQSQKDADEEQKKEIEKSMTEEHQIIEKYLKDNNITVSPNPSGLYYVQTTAGKGTQADTGKTVSVNYIGKFVDGKIFDSSVGKKPIEFVLGRGQVIPGWDEGIKLMKAGTKATFIIPSNLAYGPRGAKNQHTGEYVIPPFSPLVFEVELVDVKK